MLPVLVVEDETDIRESIVEALCEAGLEVHGALSGDDALAVLGSHRRRWLILLDLNMPRVDGWAFLDALRLFDVPDDTFRVLVTSAHPEAQSLRTHALVHGILPKPFDLPTLISTVREVAGLARRTG